MRVKKPRRINEYLEGLADFLNTGRADATEKEWERFCRRIKGHPTMGKLRVSLTEAKDIRAQIHDDFAYLRGEAPETPYAALAESLNELQLKMHYQVNTKKKLKPGQAILRSNDKRQWVAQAQPVYENTKELLYGILAAALIDGTLNRLKVCRECKKYLAVKDRKRRFCPDTSCKDDFFNRQKTQDPEFRKTARIKRKVVV